MEPFKDGKLDLVVFLQLYKLLLEGIVDNFQNSETQVATEAKSMVIKFHYRISRFSVKDSGIIKTFKRIKLGLGSLSFKRK